MHQCLTIPEILSNILHRLLEDPIHLTGESNWPSSGDRKLAKLARTCKAFTEPALDELWSFQPSLVPLVQCLPTDVITKELNGNIYQLRLLKDLQAVDYTKIYYYASRIKTLGPDVLHHGPEIHPLLAAVLWSRRPRPGPFLPNLRHMVMNIDLFVDQAIIPRLVVGPRLHTVVIKVPNPQSSDQVWGNLDAVLKDSSVAIRSFSIEAINLSDDIRADLGTLPRLMELYCSFQGLESLDTSGIQLTHNVFSHLASLPELKRLNASITGKELTKSFSSMPSGTDIFPYVAELVVEIDSLAIFTKLFKRSGLGQLRSLTVIRKLEVGTWELNSFFRTLEGHVPHPVLEEITLSKADPRAWFVTPRPSVSKFTAVTLEPLLSFPNISVLKIGLDGPVELNNTVIGRVAEAWPNLRVFRVFEHTILTTPMVTLGDGLLTLVAGCPKLEEVTLRMNASEIPSFSQIAGITPVRNLRWLNVCTSTITTSAHADLAAFLTTVFPALSSLKFGWYYPDCMHPEAMDLPDMDDVEIAYADCWDQVLTLIGPFLAADTQTCTVWDYR